MKLNYKAIIFDLDGTLVNSLDDIADALNAVLERKGFAQHSTSSYLQMIGSGARNLVVKAIGNKEDNPELIDEILVEYAKEYAKSCTVKTYVYPGIIELLNQLKQYGLSLNVLSNKPQEFTELTCKHYFGNSTFDIVFGQRKEVPRKPAPDAALEIAKLLNMNTKDILYIGDTPIDIQTAKGAGMTCVAVTWGFRSREELEANQPQYIINQPFQILQIASNAN